MQPDPAEWATTEFTIKGGGFQMASRVTVPAGPTRLTDLLPLARALADVVVRETCQALDRAGEPISCTKGCGACCRNLVAISEVEARRIRVVVEELPEPRRSTIRARFAEAREGLDGAGLLGPLRAAEHWTEEEYAERVGTYFRAGVACPFLEEGACSIYSERPIACREYLVTSPAENCARPDEGGVARVRLPLAVFNAVARWQVQPLEHMHERWVPLILAPEWAEAHPDDPPPIPGPELLRDLLGHLQGPPAGE